VPVAVVLQEMIPRAMLAFRRSVLLVATLSLLASVAGAERVPVSEPAGPREVVVLVHGMGRSPLSMAPLGWTLRRAGYDVLNWGYSSTCCSIAELGAQLEEELREHEGEAVRLHFVGHSLGNIIVRWVLAHDDDASLQVGRIVMLAPPNQGSRVADRLAPSLGWLLKPLPELGTGPMRSSGELHLPEHLDVAVIAGRFDGKVAVPETRLAGMDAHLVLPASHPFLMFRPDVHRLVLRFLESGSFGLPGEARSATRPRTSSDGSLVQLGATTPGRDHDPPRSAARTPNDELPLHHRPTSTDDFTCPFSLAH
jgi:pimeloyl-ACP methyl ester carboxylesterase